MRISKRQYLDAVTALAGDRAALIELADKALGLLEDEIKNEYLRRRYIQNIYRGTLYCMEDTTTGHINKFMSMSAMFEHLKTLYPTASRTHIYKVIRGERETSYKHKFWIEEH